MKLTKEQQTRKDYEKKLKVYLTKRDKELRNESTNSRRA
jgi:hypothetical protein